MEAHELGVGKLITDTSAARDAVHIAIAPFTASETMYPGDHVHIKGDGVFGSDERLHNSVGIVDPFLGRAVERGQRFWLFLYPGTITGLRHLWRHPAFDRKVKDPVPESIRKDWEEYAKETEKLIHPSLTQQEGV